MLRVLRHKLILITLTASAVFAAASHAPSASSDVPAVEPRANAAATDAHILECRATKAALDSEIAELRASCDAAVAAFEACRASRPVTDWSDVELFSCGFDMSTDLARGELDDTASLGDCGAAPAPHTESSPTESIQPSCPVPSCESDLELLEEAAARHAC